MDLAGLGFPALKFYARANSAREFGSRVLLHILTQDQYHLQRKTGPRRFGKGGNNPIIYRRTLINLNRTLSPFDPRKPNPHPRR